MKLVLTEALKCMNIYEGMSFHGCVHRLHVVCESREIKAWCGTPQELRPVFSRNASLITVSPLWNHGKLVMLD